MTQAVLVRALNANAFDGTPLEIDFAAFHTPFAHAGLPDVEADLAAAVRRGERLGLAGPIGCGKSSVLRYALDNPVQRLAPIWISVVRDDDEVVTEPARFVGHVVQTITDAAWKAGAVSKQDGDAILAAASERRPLPTEARGLSGKVAATFWLANGEVAREVTTTLEGQDLQRPVDELIEAARRAIEAIAALELTPVLVLDDSDAFARGRDDDSEAALVEAFFGQTLSSATRLGCGLVVAMSTDHALSEAYARARNHFGVLQRIVEIPTINDRHVEHVFERRVIHATGTPWDSVISRDAVAKLAEYEAGIARRNMRLVLTIAHQALVLAVDDDAELVDSSHVESARRLVLP